MTYSLLQYRNRSLVVEQGILISAAELLLEFLFKRGKYFHTAKTRQFLAREPLAAR